MTTDSSEVHPARLLAQAPDATIFADRDGIIRVWNAAAEPSSAIPKPTRSGSASI